MDEKEKAQLEEKLIKTYKEKGINFNDKTLYKNNKFKDAREMPVLEDLYNNLEGNLKLKLLPFVKGSMKFLIIIQM